ncbi:MAG: metallophosphoesterase family protein [Gammaproteobacteria bacterium]|nr:metallophosphoesterase family protein [Gammaproteobacteria bacterium]
MSNSIRVAIISDTHSVLHSEIKAIVEQCDIAIHAGDICNADVLTAMQPKSGKVIAVAGNNDIPHLWPEAQFDIVNNLPDIAELDLPGGKLKIEHGHRHCMQKPDHADLRAAHPEARAIIYGHTHKKIIDDYEYPWVINPGAAGHQRNRGGSSCLVLIASTDNWSIENYRFTD